MQIDPAEWNLCVGAKKGNYSHKPGPGRLMVEIEWQTLLAEF